eukprot:1142382-Pelagomonas_calceolata.AAC.8
MACAQAQKAHRHAGTEAHRRTGTQAQSHRHGMCTGTEAHRHRHRHGMCTGTRAQRARQGAEAQKARHVNGKPLLT